MNNKRGNCGKFIDKRPCSTSWQTIDGSKNAALPLMAASLLTSQTMVLSNVPHLKDVTAMLELLGYLGVDVVIDEKFELLECS